VSADKLLTVAQELAAQDGLRAAVLAYMEAVDELVAEKRVAEAQSVMIELLKAQEKKKGLFARTDKNPLGSERVTVGLKFAEVAPLGRPTEDALDQLGYLAQDFPDELTIRRANADALRQSGYAADAIDEYRYCATVVPDDALVNQNISDLYVGIGRPEDAAAYLMRALQLYAKQGDFSQLAAHAEALVELRPASIGDIIDLLASAPGEALVGHLKMLDDFTHRVTHAGIVDADQKAKAREQLQALYGRLVAADPDDEGAARGLQSLQSDAAPVERRKGPRDKAPPAALDSPIPENTPDRIDAVPFVQPIAAEALPEAVFSADIEPMFEELPLADELPIEIPPEPAPKPTPQRSPATSNALAAFTRRKAKELFDAGDLLGAAMSYERLLRSGSDIDSLEGVLTCYERLGRTQDAARVAVELVNAKEHDGDLEGAVATIDRISAISSDANFSQRRMELLVALGRPEAVKR